MNRTEYLINNPRLISSVAIAAGIPFDELEDFSQEVLITSVKRKENYNPQKSSWQTYAHRFINWCATDYKRKLQKNLPTISYREEDYNQDEN